MFDSISTSGSGLSTYQTWIDAIANNVANVNDISPTSGPAFQAQFVEATPLGAGAQGVGQGVEVSSLKYSSAQGIVTYDPNNPIADAQGNVRRADVDMGQQMGDLIMAQRALEANANLVTRAQSAYQAAINIGKGI